MTIIIILQYFTKTGEGNNFSHIAFSFRNKVWPKPMEGLELFNPVPAIIDKDSSSSSSPFLSREVSDEGSVYSEVSDGETENACSSKMSNLKMTIGKAKKGGSLTVTMHPSDGNFQVQKVNNTCPYDFQTP